MQLWVAVLCSPHCLMQLWVAVLCSHAHCLVQLWVAVYCSSKCMHTASCSSGLIYCVPLNVCTLPHVASRNSVIDILALLYICRGSYKFASCWHGHIRCLAWQVKSLQYEQAIPQAKHFYEPPVGWNVWMVCAEYRWSGGVQQFSLVPRLSPLREFHVQREGLWTRLEDITNYPLQVIICCIKIHSALTNNKKNNGRLIYKTTSSTENVLPLIHCFESEKWR